MLAIFSAMLFSPGHVLAHNEFVDSNPSDGEVVTTAPSVWEITFAKDVPLATASGEVITSDGVRSTLPSPTNGNSKNVIRFALPPDLTGPVTARWKLVSEDGHVVQGRVTFTISSSTTTGNSSPTSTPTIPPSDADGNQSTDSSITSPAPTPVRWVVRSMGFSAVMFVGGFLFVGQLLSIGALSSARGVVWSRVSASALGVVPFLQNLFLVGDIRGTNIFSAIPHFFSTFDLTVGAMLVIQTLIGMTIAYAIFTSASHALRTINQQLLTILFVMYLIALAFSGHSRTMAWPVLGIPADIVHTGAAAMWLGGLAVLTLLVIPSASIATSALAYRNFSSYARYAVIAIVVTGVIQTLRLHGDIVSLFTETHGRILLLKIAAVAVMLKIADINRKRLLHRLEPDTPQTERRISLLWRASITEVVTGGIVIAITAALVTSSFS